MSCNTQRMVQTAAHAGERDQEVVPALCATGPRETVGEDAALQVAAEFALDIAENRVGVILLV